MAHHFRWKDAKPAVVTMDVKGQFARFKTGERVNAVRSWKGSGHWSIDRATWRRPWLPLCNQLYGVPRESFKFISQKEKH